MQNAFITHSSKIAEVVGAAKTHCVACSAQKPMSDVGEPLTIYDTTVLAHDIRIRFQSRSITHKLVLASIDNNGAVVTIEILPSSRDIPTIVVPVLSAINIAMAMLATECGLCIARRVVCRRKVEP